MNVQMSQANHPEEMHGRCWYRSVLPFWRIGTIDLDARGVVTIRSLLIGSIVFSAPLVSIDADLRSPDGRRYRLRVGRRRIDFAFDHNGPSDPLSAAAHLWTSPGNLLNFVSRSPIFPTREWQTWKRILVR
jgi:hypothetical protein